MAKEEMIMIGLQLFIEDIFTADLKEKLDIVSEGHSSPELASLTQLGKRSGQEP